MFYITKQKLTGLKLRKSKSFTGTAADSIIRANSVIENNLLKRQHLYAPTSLTNIIGCGDDRDIDSLVVQLFGGVAYVTYNRNIVMDILKSGPSSSLTFDQEIKLDVKELSQLGIKAAIHSDDKTENGNDFNMSLEDISLGCAYIKLRQQISQKIYDEGEDIIANVSKRYPGLFKNDKDFELGYQVIRAHGRFAANDNYFKAGGRAVALAAISEGAPALVVKGEHNKSAVGLINTKKDTTLDSKRAVSENLPAYNHDLWAIDKINRLKKINNKRLHQIAEAIDLEGVFRALGVKEIIVR